LIPLNTGCLKIIVFRVRGLVGDILLTKEKCLKKIAVTLKKILKLSIFVQKYLINILAMLYFPFEQKLEKQSFYCFEIKLFFQEMSFHLYFNILHNHPHHISK
jgi:hypothetical protein